MNTLIAVIAIILGIVGIIGSVVPGIPGPPLNWVGLLCLKIGDFTWHGEPMSITLLMVMLAVTIIVTVLDYVVPAYFTKVTGGSKYGGWGSVIGLFLGMFFTPIGMVMGAILGAFIAELIFANKDAGSSLKSAMGAFLGFLFGTGIKLISSAVMMYYILVFAF